MRLGDLDALYDCVEARYRLSSGEEHKAEKALLDAICGSPTIPAIHVVWIREKIYGSRLRPGELNALLTVITMWKKEQEAR